MCCKCICCNKKKKKAEIEKEKVEEPTLEKKLLVLGLNGSGKSSLLQRWCAGQEGSFDTPSNTDTHELLRNVSQIMKAYLRQNPQLVSTCSKCYSKM